MKPAKQHPDKALSPVQVRNVKVPGRYGDGNGLYLVVEPSASKHWILRTVVRRKRMDIGLGSLRLVSLAEAREEALRLRKIARAGGDPLAERRAARQITPTFEAAACAVHTAHEASWRNPKHAAQWISTLKQYVFPIFGQKEIDKVESADVMKALSPIWLSKPETARRVMQRASTVFEWAKASGLRRGDNPVDGVSKVLPKQNDVATHHAALPYKEVPKFIKVLRKTDANAASRLALEYVILTLARTTEGLETKPAEIQAAKKTWVVPASRMKMKQEHRVPLAPQCMDIYKKARTLHPKSAFVFPGQADDKPLSNMALLMLLRRMKVNVTVHGFRSSFRDWAAEQTNFPSAVCEAALAHKLKDKTEAAYNRTDLFDKRRELMNQWAAFCTGVKAGK